MLKVTIELSDAQEQALIHEYLGNNLQNGKKPKKDHLKWVMREKIKALFEDTTTTLGQKYKYIKPIYGEKNENYI